MGGDDETVVKWEEREQKLAERDGQWKIKRGDGGRVAVSAALLPAGRPPWTRPSRPVINLAFSVFP